MVIGKKIFWFGTVFLSLFIILGIYSAFAATCGDKGGVCYLNPPTCQSEGGRGYGGTTDCSSGVTCCVFPPSTLTAAPPDTCGNGVPNAGENCINCPYDVGSCPTSSYQDYSHVCANLCDFVTGTSSCSLYDAMCWPYEGESTTRACGGTVSYYHLGDVSADTDCLAVWGSSTCYCKSVCGNGHREPNEDCDPPSGSTYYEYGTYCSKCDSTCHFSGGASCGGANQLCDTTSGCIACGAGGQKCCANNACNTGYACTSGICQTTTPPCSRVTPGFAIGFSPQTGDRGETLNYVLSLATADSPSCGISTYTFANTLCPSGFTCSTPGPISIASGSVNVPITVKSSSSATNGQKTFSYRATNTNTGTQVSASGIYNVQCVNTGAAGVVLSSPWSNSIVNGTSATLKWLAETNWGVNCAGNTNQYMVLYQAGNTPGWPEKTRVTSATTQYTVTGLSPATKYTWAIYPTNGAFYTQWYSWNFTTQATMTATYSCSGSNKIVTLNWGAWPNGAQTYTTYYKQSSSPTWLGLGGSQSTTTYTSSAGLLTPNTNYDFAVKIGSSFWANISGQNSGSACPFCGDGIVQAGESCDDGANNGLCPKTCSSTCTLNSCSICGNGILEAGESCDFGKNATNPAQNNSNKDLYSGGDASVCGNDNQQKCWAGCAILQNNFMQKGNYDCDLTNIYSLGDACTNYCSATTTNIVNRDCYMDSNGLCQCVETTQAVCTTYCNPSPSAHCGGFTCGS